MGQEVSTAAEPESPTTEPRADGASPQPNPTGAGADENADHSEVIRTELLMQEAVEHTESPSFGLRPAPSARRNSKILPMDILKNGRSPTGERPSRSQHRSNSLVVVGPDGQFEVFGAASKSSIHRVAPLCANMNNTSPMAARAELTTDP